MIREKEAQRYEREDPVCESGIVTFHIDAFGQLQLCSGNRTKSYDLRKGSFRDGFYNHLPSFPCRLPRKEIFFKRGAVIPIEVVSMR